MTSLRRTAAVVATAVALAASAALAGPAHAADTGPTCPDHPNVPWIGSFVGTDGKTDVYRVPNRFGFSFVRVVCH